MPSTDPVEAPTCTKCGQAVIRRGHFWVLESEADSQMVTMCPEGGIHDVEDPDAD